MILISFHLIFILQVNIYICYIHCAIYLSPIAWSYTCDSGQIMGLIFCLMSNFRFLTFSADTRHHHKSQTDSYIREVKYINKYRMVMVLRYICVIHVK